MPRRTVGYVVCVFLLLVACSPALTSTDVSCDPDQFFDQLWRFNAETQGPIDGAEVAFLVNGAEFGVLPLNEVEDANWYGEAFESTVGVACDDEVDEVTFLFAVESAQGRIEREHSWP